MQLRVILRWATTALFAVFALPIIVLNVERLAEQRGWDQFLAAWWGPVMLDLASWATQSWVWMLAGFFAGAALTFWVSERLPRSPRLAKTASLQLFAPADGSVPREVQSENVHRWYWLVNQLSYIEKDTQQFVSKFVITLFILFENPVLVSNLYVSSSDAQLPRWEVKEFKPQFAIIAFMGQAWPATIDISVKTRSGK